MMTVDEYTALQDDGCPNCPGHVPYHPFPFVLAFALPVNPAPAN